MSIHVKIDTSHLPLLVTKGEYRARMNNYLHYEGDRYKLLMRPKLELTPLKERELVDSLMKGDDDIDIFIQDYPMDFYKLLRNHVDFSNWFDKELALDVETIKAMTEVDSDVTLELAKSAPKGFLSMVLSTQKTIDAYTKMKPMIFFRLAEARFPDITAEYYICAMIRKIADYWTEQDSRLFSSKTDVHLNGPFHFLRLYKFWDYTTDKIPSLSQYFQVDQSWIQADVLDACRKNKEVRRKTHDLFRIVYPLGLPHMEYCYTQDVLLLIRVWMIDRIVFMLLDKLSRKSLFERLKDTVGKLATAKSHSYFNLITFKYYQNQRNMYISWLYIKKKTKPLIKNNPHPYIQEIVRDKENNTSLSWPLGKDKLPDLTNEVGLGPLLKLQEKGIRMDDKEYGQVSKNSKMEDLDEGILFDAITTDKRSLFGRVLTLQSLLDYYENGNTPFIPTIDSGNLPFITTIDEGITQLKSLKKANNTSLSREERLENVDIEIDLDVLRSVKNYYLSWRNDILNDIKQHPEDEMFTSSNLLKTLNIDQLFSPFNKPEEESLKWLHFLSKRIQYFEYSPEAQFYGFGSSNNNVSTLSSLCVVCKGKSYGNQEPFFNVNVCNEKCQMVWYESKGLSSHFFV